MAMARVPVQVHLSLKLPAHLCVKYNSVAFMNKQSRAKVKVGPQPFTPTGGELLDLDLQKRLGQTEDPWCEV